MADDPRPGDAMTGDILRPVRTRASGTKAIAYYGLFSVLAVVAIVYLVGIFSAPHHDEGPPPGATSPSRTANASEAFRYGGRVVDDRVPLRRIVTPTAAPSGAVAVAVAPPVATPLIAVPRIDVPDPSESWWATHRVPLPTPAVGEDRAPASAPPQGIDVVYGAPTVATAPVSDTPPATLPSAAPRALADPTASPTAERGETLAGVRRPPPGRYLIPAGTEIAVQLDVALESDLPGPVRAHVVRDVVDSLAGSVLIPAGTAVLGQYTALAGGQSRLAIVWTRLVFPDRSSFALDNLAALDANGQAGVGGALDDHRAQIIRTTTFAGIVAEIARRVGAQPSGNVVIVNGTTEPGLGASLLDTANELVRQDLAAPPTVTIAANTLVTLYVDRDMLFAGPYAPLAAAP